MEMLEVPEELREREDGEFFLPPGLLTLLHSVYSCTTTASKTGRCRSKSRMRMDLERVWCVEKRARLRPIKT